MESSSLTTNSSSPSVLKNDIKLDIIVKVILANRKKYLLPVLITTLVTAALSLCVPRYYTANVILAPEYSKPTSNMGSLGSLASSFGVNLGNMSSEDAITPTFYPDLMQSTVFLVDLLDTPVMTKDSTFKGTYQEYMTQHQEFPFWTVGAEMVKTLFSKKPEKLNTSSDYKINPYSLTKLENQLVEAVGGNISCIIDKKTDIISISTTAQDPLVAALMADTVKMHLQNFIIQYRTQKARTDLEHISHLLKKSEADYKAAQVVYADYVDRHTDVSLQTFRSKQEELENALQSAYNTFQSVQQRYHLAEAKVLERTPAFTTIKNVTVPTKHAGPKRMIVTALATIFAFICCTIVFVVRYQKQ